MAARSWLLATAGVPLAIGREDLVGGAVLMFAANLVTIVSAAVRGWRPCGSPGPRMVTQR